MSPAVQAVAALAISAAVLVPAWIVACRWTDRHCPDRRPSSATPPDRSGRLPRRRVGSGAGAVPTPPRCLP